MIKNPENESSRPAFSGTWLLRHGTPLPGRSPSDVYRSFLVFFRWRGQHYVTTFSGEGIRNIPGYSLDSYTIKTDRIRLIYGEPGDADYVSAKWRKEPDASLTIYKSDSSDNFLPGSFEDAIARGFDRKELEEFLATARQEGWKIDPVARFPDGSVAERPAKPARSK